MKTVVEDQKTRKQQLVALLEQTEDELVLDLVEGLLQPQSADMPEWHERILEERMKNLDTEPVYTSEEVHRQMREKFPFLNANAKV